MTDCKHVELKLLEGPLHAGGKDYVCKCGEQFRTESLTVTVGFGIPPAQSRSMLKRIAAQSQEKKK